MLVDSALLGHAERLVGIHQIEANVALGELGVGISRRLRPAASAESKLRRPTIRLGASRTHDTDSARSMGP